MMNQYPNYGMQYSNYMSPYQTQYGCKQDIVKVNGKNGAEAYQLAPNSSALLLDESMPIVWLKQTDGAGYPSLTPYTITPYQPEPSVDLKALEERIMKLEDKVNAKPDTSSNKRNEKSE